MLKSHSIIILAAGQGTRMYSKLPKVLHTIAGKSMLQHIFDTTVLIKANKTYVICGYGKEQLQSMLADANVQWIEQKEQLGTGHAVQQALPHLGNETHVIVLVGDTPLISQATLTKLMEGTPKNGLGLLTAHVDNPTGLGRILRNEANQIIGIVEEKDATDVQRTITEINTGIMCLPVPQLKQWLSQLKSHNQQGELYLTDVIAMAAAEQCKITHVAPDGLEEILSVNDRAQLAKLERHYQWQQAKQFMQAGVTLFDPHRFDVRGECRIGKDVIIDTNVILEGKVTIANNVTIGANVILKNATVDEGATIHPFSHIEGATIGKDAQIGPYARLRPDTIIAAMAKVGNFVEVKKSSIGVGSKVNHLSYIGDATLGQQVNVGAGTITCNYDGVNKFKTTIEDGAFIGSNTALVAPITIGKNATVGAGSTLNNDAPNEKLTISRVKARTIENWKRPLREN